MPMREIFDRAWPCHRKSCRKCCTYTGAGTNCRNTTSPETLSIGTTSRYGRWNLKMSTLRGRCPKGARNLRRAICAIWRLAGGARQVNSRRSTGPWTPLSIANSIDLGHPQAGHSGNGVKSQVGIERIATRIRDMAPPAIVLIVKPGRGELRVGAGREKGGETRTSVARFPGIFSLVAGRSAADSRSRARLRQGPCPGPIARGVPGRVFPYCAGDSSSRQNSPCLHIAFRIASSLRAQAIGATFSGFPLSASRS